jgi:hypothetical protein
MLLPSYHGRELAEWGEALPEHVAKYVRGGAIGVFQGPEI